MQYTSCKSMEDIYNAYSVFKYSHLRLIIRSRLVLSEVRNIEIIKRDFEQYNRSVIPLFDIWFIAP